MKSLQTILFCFLSFLGMAQSVEFEKTNHDFDEVYSFSDRFVDVKLTNKGSKREFVLSVKKPNEVVYLFSGKEMQPDSSVVLRFQVNPQEKGRFSYDIEVFTSDRMEPVKLKLKGSMEDELVQGNNFQSCPTFGQRAPGVDPTAFDMTIVCIDKKTQRPLPKTNVTLIQNGRVVGTFKSDKNGKIVEQIPLGFSYFYAEKNKYSSDEKGGYVNFKRNYVVLELEPLEEELVVETVPDPIPEPDVEETIEPAVVDSDLVIVIEEELEEEEEASPLQEKLQKKEAVELPPALAELDLDDFSDENFAPVNVVFVLDVSSSMRNLSKLDLMKYSLYTLTEMMRPQDKIGLVAYGSKAEVILSPTSGANKEEINKEVEALKASGMTAGGAGIKKGFKEAKKSLIADGVNRVIIITDGAFNKDSKDYKRAVRPYKKYGITMSVVGIKNKEPDAEKMKEAAEVGRGVYIPIFNLADAQNNLKQEIRKSSFRF